MRWLVALSTALSTATATISPAAACGPFFDCAVFSYESHPDLPLMRFAAGELGILRPEYARSYLIVAYRYLANRPLTQSEQAGAIRLWKQRLTEVIDTPELDKAKSTWLANREKVVKSDEKSKLKNWDLDSYKAGSDYWSYLNYPADSYRNAAETLDRLLVEYGAESPHTIAWVKAQDIVFSNSSKEKANIPEALPESSPSDIQEERRYQIACANFYAGNFTKAIELFEEIGKCDNSRWSKWAPYLIARTYIRKGLIGEKAPVIEDLRKAETILKELEASKSTDPRMKKLARAHLQLVQSRLEPGASLETLIDRLMSVGKSSDWARDLGDATVILDQALMVEDKSKIVEKMVDNCELLDFLLLFQSGGKIESEEESSQSEQSQEKDEQSRNESLSYFQKSLSKLESEKSDHNGLPWLICALHHAANLASPSEKAIEPDNHSYLLARANAVPANSCAYLSVNYYLASYLEAMGEKDRARAILEKLLLDNRTQTLHSSSNLIKDKLLTLIKDQKDFFRLLPRHSAGRDYFVFIDERADFFKAKPETSQSRKFANLIFEPISANFLNYRAPLTFLGKAAALDTLDDNMRSDACQAIWVRATLLGDWSKATEASSNLEKCIPTLGRDMQSFRAAGVPEDKRFESVYTLLRYPGLRPYVTAGLSREVEINKIDNYRDNWWDKEELSRGSFTMPDKNKSNLLAEHILSAEERNQGAKEWQMLQASTPAPNYMAAAVLAHAKRKPTDPRLPEALHLAVRATRYGNTDEKTTGFSRDCFKYLHKNFPGNQWTKKTPYYF